MATKGKVRDILKILRADGWLYDYSTGGHDHYSHPAKQGKVTVPGKPSMDLRVKTWDSILKQAGLE
jgi:predicted RNA binding protein YcfA (HicA-like mRNA interferase family)